MNRACFDHRHRYPESCRNCNSDMCTDCYDFPSCTVCSNVVCCSKCLGIHLNKVHKIKNGMIKCRLCNKWEDHCNFTKCDGCSNILCNKCIYESCCDSILCSKDCYLHHRHKQHCSSDSFSSTSSDSE
jgi:hypothetical protein